MRLPNSNDYTLLTIVGLAGVEPAHHVYKTCTLPLHHRPIWGTFFDRTRTSYPRGRIDGIEHLKCVPLYPQSQRQNKSRTAYHPMVSPILDVATSGA